MRIITLINFKKQIRMEEIKLIILKLKKEVFNEENTSIDLNLRIFYTQTNSSINDINLYFGCKLDEKIIWNAKENCISQWKTLTSNNPGIVEKKLSLPKAATHFIITYKKGEIEKEVTQYIEEQTDLLPSNATAFERVLALTTARLSALSQYIISPFDIEKTPQQTLPWLAWLFSVDDWDPSLDTKTQRNLIINSIKIHRKKGTKASIKEALKAIGDSVEVKEWWEKGMKSPTSEKDYYKFNIYLNINNTETATFTDKYYQKIKKRVDNLKPVSTNYNLALKADADCKAGVVLLGYALTRLSLQMELKD